ncbi:hypothetical protein H7J82_01635 [Mycolicibacterium poriferae]|nr:hypothetical protein [Mycolicibacterium poriferae]
MPDIAWPHKFDAAALDEIAWGFLCSEYAGQQNWDAPLDRRLDTYLRHRHLDHILNDGSAYSAVLDRVMANFRRARRSGVLGPPHR